MVTPTTNDTNSAAPASPSRRHPLPPRLRRDLARYTRRLARFAADSGDQDLAFRALHVVADRWDRPSPTGPAHDCGHSIVCLMSALERVGDLVVVGAHDVRTDVDKCDAREFGIVGHLAREITENSRIIVDGAKLVRRVARWAETHHTAPTTAASKGGAT